MLKNNLFKSASYFALICSIIISTDALASSNYLCPEPNRVAGETLEAINQGLNEVTIHTDYGTLTTDLRDKDIETISTELNSHLIPAFKHASILFEDIEAAPYDVACSYEVPDLTFHMHNNKLFIGTTDYYWQARGQGQKGPYAWCTGGGNVKFCSFIDKPLA